jgi:hypothetical protein
MFLANKLNKGAGAPEPKDPQFNYVTMLLHGDGTNGAQNNTFLDSSTNNFTITRNGNTTQGSFSPYGSNWSNYFDQSSYFFVGTNSAYNFSSGSWTYECWINLSGTNTSTYYTVFTNGYPIQIYVTNNAFEAYIGTSNGSGGQIVNGQRTSAGSVPVGSWVHFALVRNSANSTYKMYVNGVEQASTTSATDPVASTFNFTLPAFGPAPFGFTQPFLGYISNFRATASAVYTSNFTPSTTPLTAISGTGLLTCADNRFIDDSTNNFAISIGSGNPSVQRFNPFGTSTAYSTSVIGGSGYFDSSDYLSLADNANLNPSTQDFVMEAWVYLTGTTGNNQGINGKGTPGTDGYTLFVTNALVLSFVWNGTGGATITGGTLVLNTWNHVAVVRNSSVIRLYLNGVGAGSSTACTTDITSTETKFVGQARGGNPMLGYMSNYRMTKGSLPSGYDATSSTLTVPTAPLTAISGTSLLLSYINGAIFDNAMMNNLETVGNAQISTSVVKYGTGSLAFDGTGDYLSTRSTPNLAFGSGNFTIECWAYATSLGSYNALFAQWPDNGGTANNSYTLESVGSNMEFYWATSSGLQGPATLGTITTGVWIHWAICRSGNTLYPFKNGVLGTTVSITDAPNSPTSAVTIGGAVAGGGEWIGYIDDLRITKGYARYTANFTPPTLAFPNIGPV